MGRRRYYKPGSFYRVDDRTGFTVAAERARKQWDGQIVDERVWEARQPQDFVRGVKDNQSVPDARPPPPPDFGGPIFLTLTATAAAQATVITVDDASRVAAHAAIGVMLDTGASFLTGIQSIGAGGQLTISPRLPSKASAGNLVAYYAGNEAPAGTITLGGQQLTV